MEENLAAGCREFRPTMVIAIVMDVTAGVFWNLVKPGALEQLAG